MNPTVGTMYVQHLKHWKYHLKLQLNHACAKVPKPKVRPKIERKSRAALGGRGKFSPSPPQFGTQIILSVLLAAAIVSQGRQSRSLRVFLGGRRNTKDSTVTYIILTEPPGKHISTNRGEKSNK